MSSKQRQNKRNIWLGVNKLNLKKQLKTSFCDSVLKIHNSRINIKVEVRNFLCSKQPTSVINYMVKYDFSLDGVKQIEEKLNLNL